MLTSNEVTRLRSKEVKRPRSNEVTLPRSNEVTHLRSREVTQPRFLEVKVPRPHRRVRSGEAWPSTTPTGGLKILQSETMSIMDIHKHYGHGFAIHGRPDYKCIKRSRAP